MRNPYPHCTRWEKLCRTIYATDDDFVTSGPLNSASLRNSKDISVHAIATPEIQQLIHVIRGHKVMLDRDLARLYGVETFNLNKAVGRNRDRFPRDFMFRLTKEEYASLRFQTGILKRGQHSKYLPLAFTQEGVAMLSSVLRSRKAVRVNIEIMRAFVNFRNMIFDRRQLAERLTQLETHLAAHDIQIHAIFDAIRDLVELPLRRKRRIGFKT